MPRVKNNERWRYVSEDWPDQRVNWNAMSRSQKAYTIDMYNRAKRARGEDPVPNPFRNDHSAIYINPDGSETVTPRTPGKPLIRPIPSNTTPPPAAGAGPIIDALRNQAANVDRQRILREQNEIAELQAFFDSEAGQHFVDSLPAPPSPLTAGQSSDSANPQEPQPGPSGISNKRPAETQAGNDPSRQRVGDPVTSPATTTSTTTEAMPEAMDTSASSTALVKGADGGFDSTSGPASYLFKGGYKSTHGTLEFTKVHQITIEAFPYTAFALTNSKYVVTPLARIDWDRPYFYMSPEDFDKIPAGSHFDSVNCDIMGITFPTGYPTGGTTASVSATNHAKILLAGIDLEKKNRGSRELLVTTASAENVPTGVSANTDTQVTDFIAKQYGSIQSDTDANFTIAGCATDIPYRLRKFWSIYQPNRATAKLNGFFEEVTEPEPAISVDRSVGQEYFRNYITSCNANDYVWNKDLLSALVGSPSLNYKFVSAPIGEQFQHREISIRDVNSQAVGGMRHYNMLRNVTNTNIGGNLTITESIVPSSANTVPLVTYKNRIEQGATFVKGDVPNAPARQPSFHIGMKAIEKFDPTSTSSRSSSFVQARMTLHIRAHCKINLPSYPDRFIRSKQYNTTMEQAVAGIGRYQNGADNSFITFNAQPTGSVAPTLDFVDRPISDTNSRPRRALPDAGVPPVRRSTRRRGNNNEVIVN